MSKINSIEIFILEKSLKKFIFILIIANIFSLNILFVSLLYLSPINIILLSIISKFVVFIIRHEI